ncbi:MAG: DNA starvation/stationary phase protection protein Dps [Armatimonadetes bacterium]|nr:DNA starvation/stationary phase protection protein Dps [Armatimonadota bacterium]
MATRHLPVAAKDAKTVAGYLAPILLNVLELHNQVKSAHWNLRDPDFHAVHTYLDEVAEAVYGAGDEIAERIRQLGEVAVADTQTVAKNNSLDAFPKGELNKQQALGAVANGLQKAVESLRKGIAQTSDETDEPITADLLTGISGDFEKHLWFVDSHLKN